MLNAMPWTDILPSELALASKLKTSAKITGVTCDSRSVGAGVLFFAIPGTQNDGHDFVEEVLSKGAFAVVEREACYEAHPNVIRVSSCRKAFSLACAAWFGHPSAHFQLVGVTGTNGKTTTAHLCEQVWEALGFKTGRLGTVNYKVGDQILESALTTPDAYTVQSLFSQMRASGVCFSVMEVSSIALDQDRVLGSRFAAALYTNLTQDHLDYHGDVESYFAAKEKLFREMSPGFAVICTEDEFGRRLQSQPYPVYTFSRLDRNADFYAQDLRCDLAGSRARVRTPSGFVDLRLHILGGHNVINAVGVLALCHGLGLEAEAVAHALSNAKGAPGRLEAVRAKGRAHVFVDYAHTPDALLNVLRLLHDVRGQSGGKVFCVFGCGGDRDKGKRPLMARVACEWSDVCIATSDNPRTEDPDAILDDIEKGISRGTTQYKREVDRRKAIGLALSMAGPRDIVLIAGKGHENYQILGTTKIHFDDVEVVRDYYQI
ncbi:MAG: UDP-N-acetylmuramoyl-L-alanyl-D-glutamate--2,6-diaminopimelate ligase [Bdellovibrionales bacterium]|nr:UDP-N-acetylmuramoyl-L-alanyl-D-glutamate--2,6-diaminopimelate ligase [Bdellovibrionales bacterium]